MERSVHGVKSSGSLVWLNAVGLVDADDRTNEQIQDLKHSGIYALPCYSIESLYYHDEIMRKVAERVSQLTGKGASEMVEEAVRRIREAVVPHRDRLCARLSEKRVRVKVMEQLPSHTDILGSNELNINVNVEGILDVERQKFDETLSAESVNPVVDRYPLRETPALNSVAKSLGFKSRQDYEASVRKLLIDDEESKNILRALLSDLTAKIYELEHQ